MSKHWRSLLQMSQFLRFGLLALRSRFISEALPFYASQGEVGACAVTNAERNAVTVAKIKFGKVPVKMLLTAMLIDADHATLEDAVIAFDGVGGDEGPGWRLIPLTQGDL